LRAADGGRDFFSAAAGDPVSAAAGALRPQPGPKAGSKPFPWDAALHAGLCHLRLKPKIFWALTPVELNAMAGGLAQGSAALGRAGLAALMAAYPDGGEGL